MWTFVENVPGTGVFSKSGFTKAVKTHAQHDDVKLVGLDDLFMAN